MRSFALVLLLLVALCSACEPTAYRPCPSTYTDPTKQLYQEVLTELIKHGLMHAYLPDEDRATLDYHFQDAYQRQATPADSVWLRYHLVRFQHRLFRDSARFQTFYLNTDSTRRYTQVADLPATVSALQAIPKLAAMLQAIAPHQQQAALGQLNTVQQRLQPADVQLCTATLLPAPPFGSPSQEKGVGIITLSNVVFNAAHDQALLAYGWQCGGNCGYGTLLWVEKVNGHWRIKQEAGTWIA